MLTLALSRSNDPFRFVFSRRLSSWSIFCDISCFLELSLLHSGSFRNISVCGMFSSANSTLRKALYRRSDDGTKDDKERTLKKGTIFPTSRWHTASSYPDSEQPRSGQLKPRFRKSAGKRFISECDRPLSISIDRENIRESSTSCDIPRRSSSASPHAASPISAYLLSSRQFRKASAPVVRLSPSLFVASRHEHPTVYDFEGWHSDSDDSKFLFQFQSSFNLSSEQFSLQSPIDGITPEFYKVIFGLLLLLLSEFSNLQSEIINFFVSALQKSASNVDMFKL